MKVIPIKSNKSDLPQTKFMKSGVINKFPSMLLNVGRSGSGKSSVVAFLLDKPKFMGDFFDKIFIFSPTAELDDITAALRIPKKRQFTEPEEADLDKILEDQKKLIKIHGVEKVGKASKVLIIFEDIISNKRFLESKAMLKLATMGRHFLISSIINTQSFTKVPRGIRLQANGLILFPSNQNEVALVAEDLCPPHHSKKDFLKLIEHATNGRHDFLFCNMFEPAEDRFRKNFDTILNIE